MWPAELTLRKSKSGIQLAVDAIIEELKKMSKKIENSKPRWPQVGTSSAPIRILRSGR